MFPLRLTRFSPRCTRTPGRPAVRSVAGGAAVAPRRLRGVGAARAAAALVAAPHAARHAAAAGRRAGGGAGRQLQGAAQRGRRQVRRGQGQGGAPVCSAKLYWVRGATYSGQGVCHVPLLGTVLPAGPEFLSPLTRPWYCMSHAPITSRHTSHRLQVLYSHPHNVLPSLARRSSPFSPTTGTDVSCFILHRSSALTLADMPLLPVVYSGQVPGTLGLHAPARASTVALHHKEAAMALARSGGMSSAASTGTAGPSRFNSLPTVHSTEGTGAGKAAPAELAATDSTTTQGNSVYLTPAQSGFSDHQLQQQQQHLLPPSRGASVSVPQQPGPDASPPQQASFQVDTGNVAVASEGAGQERNSHESASAADWLLGLPGALPAAVVAAGENGGPAAHGGAPRVPAPEVSCLALATLPLACVGCCVLRQG